MATRNQVLSWLEGLTFDDWEEYHSHSEVMNLAKAAIDLIESQPEIVRCGECLHWIGGGIDDKDNFIPPRCTLFNEPQTSTWFCPEGQREDPDMKETD